MSLPIIDISPLLSGSGDVDQVSSEIRTACGGWGFFYLTGHGVSETLVSRLEKLSHRFFAQDERVKLEIGMRRGGRAWRGYFPIGSELTSGRPDLKEGIYFGAELDTDHPKVLAGVPLHGNNLFPDIPDFRETVLEYIEALSALGHVLMRGFALSLGLEADYFRDRYTRDPFVLFRIFHYPPLTTEDAGQSMWGVGEHTDYGFLTILWQDEAGGLQVKVGSEWIEAPPLPGSFVCNIGDMLERVTGGRYRSTPHRVRNISDRSRLSLPFFFDPGFDVELKPIEGIEVADDDGLHRWDKQSVHTFEGTYGDYVLEKVARVFPDLGRDAL